MSGKEQQNTQAPDEPIPCVKGCGMLGNLANGGFCPKCATAEAQAASMSSPSVHASPRTPVPEEEPGASVEERKDSAVQKDSSAQKRKLVVDSEDAAKSPMRIQKNTKRCFSCRKKVGLLGFKCKCGFVYCSEHRYAEAHACEYDFQSEGRLRLSDQNPLVQAAKVEHI